MLPLSPLCSTRLRRLRCIGLLAAAVGLAGPLGSVAQTAGPSAAPRLPSLGDAIADDFDVIEEQRLGQRIMNELRRDPDYLDDPLLSEYIQQLWQPLLQAARQRGDIDANTDTRFSWDTFQVRDRSVNAFALPGGHVGVHLGLITLTGSGAELASVLAHELTHITQRHIARSMVNSRQQGSAALAAMLLGIIVAARSPTPDAAQALIVGGQAAMIQGQLNFSRDMEREADHIGLQLLASAGYPSSGMAAMFQKLEANSRLNDGNAFPYLRSHPLTIDRISAARLRANEAPGSLALSALEHALMQARARVLQERDEQALRRLQALAGQGSPAQDAARLGVVYAGALASLSLRDWERAEQLLADAHTLRLQRFASDGVARRVLALLRLELNSQRPSGAASAQRLAESWAALADDPSRPALLARTQAALAWHQVQPEAARPLLQKNMEDLQTWLTEHRSDVLAWQALSQAAQALGQRLRAMRAAAEMVAQQGDLVGGLNRYRSALQAVKAEASPDYVEASIIQSRLRELEAEHRRLLLELRERAGAGAGR